MMRSMFSGVSGLKVHQTKMDVIANNISNVNTNGFKASRVTFKEVFSQTISGASRSNAETNKGGVNAMQIGLGAGVASIDNLMTTGAAQRTDNPFDVMIDGDSFFIVGDNSGTYFTRAGAFNIDADGNLVTASGLKVMGWDAVQNPLTGEWSVIKGTVQPLVIAGDKEYVKPEATTSVSFSKNLNNVDLPYIDGYQTKEGRMEIYDSVGNRYTVDIAYSYIPATYVMRQASDINGDPMVDDNGDPVMEIDPDVDGTGRTQVETEAYWDYKIGNMAYVNGDSKQGVFKLDVTYAEPSTANPYPSPTIKFVDKLATPYSSVTYSSIAALSFNTSGDLISAIPFPGTADGTIDTLTVPEGDPVLTQKKFNLSFKANDLLMPNAYFGLPNENNNINFNFTDITQFGNKTSNATALRDNGDKPGTLVGMSIGSDGTIMGRYSNSAMRILGQIAVATFSNPAGLEKVGDNLFAVTANSGEFDGVGEEVGASGGSMMSGVLEMSNVDLSTEFTEMITTQRGFQANSRIITTSDDMLQELVNLKR